MPKRDSAELEKKDIILFKGDWSKLDLLLAGTRLTVTQFIRHLVHNKIASIESRVQDQHKLVETPDVLAGTDISELPHLDTEPSGVPDNWKSSRASKP